MAGEAPDVPPKAPGPGSGQPELPQNARDQGYGAPPIKADLSDQVGNCEHRAVQHQYTPAEEAWRPDPSSQSARAQAWRQQDQALGGQHLELKDGKYTVQSGDCMSEIASRSLRDQGIDKANGQQIDAEIKRIVSLNTDAYPGLQDNPHLIHPGMELRIPDCKGLPPVEVHIPPVEQHPQPAPQPPVQDVPPQQLPPPRQELPPAQPYPPQQEVPQPPRPVYQQPVQGDYPPPPVPNANTQQPWQQPWQGQPPCPEGSRPYYPPTATPPYYGGGYEYPPPNPVGQVIGTVGSILGGVAIGMVIGGGRHHDWDDGWRHRHNWGGSYNGGGWNGGGWNNGSYPFYGNQPGYSSGFGSQIVNNNTYNNTWINQSINGNHNNIGPIMIRQRFHH